MLQILSGKFFSGGKLNQKEADAILYSNYAWVSNIQTSVAELRPVDTFGERVASYVLRYTNRYEPLPKDVLVFAHADEAVNQFRLLASIYFQAIFHVDRSYVENLCRTQASNSFDRTVPKGFVPKYFDLGLRGSSEEVTGFVAFMTKVLSMPRKDYRLLLACLEGFFNALEALGKNFDLAYSMVVYVLEALSKSGEQCLVQWDDFDQNARQKLDEAVVGLDQARVKMIRSALLNNPHLKLKKRFVTFIIDHLNDSFFTSEAVGVKVAVAKSELERALGNLYSARSSYVHELKQVNNILRMSWIGSDSDIVDWSNEPHFTFSGLVRMARHVIRTFVDRRPVIQKESCDWRRELPGIIEVQFAPEYWAANPDGFQPARAEQYFTGFLDHLVEGFTKSNSGLLDLRPICDKIETLVDGSTASARRSMLALYWLFNGFISEKDRRPNWERFLDRWKSELEICSIELMAMYTIFDHPLPWPPEVCMDCLKQYQRSRYKKLSISLPRLLEIAVMGEIANQFKKNGQPLIFETVLREGILDAGGHPDIQEHLKHCLENRKEIDSQFVLKRLKAKEEKTDEAHPGERQSQESVAVLAYYLWQTAGQPNGRDLEFWLEAENEHKMKSQ